MQPRDVFSPDGRFAVPKRPVFYLAGSGVTFVSNSRKAARPKLRVNIRA